MPVTFCLERSPILMAKVNASNNKIIRDPLVKYAVSLADENNLTHFLQKINYDFEFQNLIKESILTKN